MFPDLKAIYFDLDDTLCAYWDAAKRGLTETFESVPVDGMTPEGMYAAWARAFRAFCPHLKKLGFYPSYLRSGETTRTELMARTLSSLGIEDRKLAKHLSDVYYERRHANLHLFDDSRGVLTSLKERYQLGVVTNGPADTQREELRILGLSDTFDFVYIEGELGFGKPKPEVFCMAREAAAADPGQLLFVGNSFNHDIRPAIEAGWHTIWIRRPSDVPPSADGDAVPEEHPVGAPHPSAIVSSLLEVRQLLDS